MASSSGSTLLGWAGFGGIPGTIIAFSINPALGLVVLAATIAAFAYGMKQEREADSERHMRESTYVIQREQLEREAKHAACQKEYEALLDDYNAGNIDDDELEEKEAEILARMP
jgi:hypothetical protein